MMPIRQSRARKALLAVPFADPFIGMVESTRSRSRPRGPNGNVGATSATLAAATAGNFSEERPRPTPAITELCHRGDVARRRHTRRRPGAFFADFPWTILPQTSLSAASAQEFRADGFFETLRRKRFSSILLKGSTM
jgi:hypothetical protein